MEEGEIEIYTRHESEDPKNSDISNSDKNKATTNDKQFESENSSGFLPVAENENKINSESNSGETNQKLTLDRAKISQIPIEENKETTNNEPSRQEDDTTRAIDVAKQEQDEIADAKQQFLNSIQSKLSDYPLPTDQTSELEPLKPAE